jgi:outer membrane receptor protein involved in Fe transport
VVSHKKILDKSRSLTNSLYYSNYDFELYSNFTFYLNDPINGDQIRQKESRELVGLKSQLDQSFNLGSITGNLQGAVGFRHDVSRGNELSHTVNRLSVLDSMKLGDIYETNLYSYINTELNRGKWLLNIGLRFDQFEMTYQDYLQSQYTNMSISNTIVSPKLNLLFNPTNQLQLYLKSGKGFHSNDTRVAVVQNGRNVLPGAWGSDAGVIWKPFARLMINTAYWYLFMEEEFVYVGDEGVVEPSGKTERMGYEGSIRYQPFNWLFWNLDATYTIARSLEAKEGIDYIPLAPDFSLVSSLQVIHPSGLFGGLQLRVVDDRPANEDNSIVAKGYSVIDFNCGYQWKNFDWSINVQNLTNTEWNETQFATISRLRDETSPLEEIHFTPGTPFNLKTSLTYKF